MPASAHAATLLDDDFMTVHILKVIMKTNLEVQRSLAGEISLVPSQGYYNVWTGLSLKLFNPILCPNK